MNSSIHSNPIEKVIFLLSKMPGIGSRSAKRILFNLIQNRDTLLLPLTEALEDLNAKIKVCEKCNNIDITNPCSICSNLNRNHELLCVIEDISSLWALEKSKAFDGLYFILGGTLSSLNPKSAAYTNIGLLESRIRGENFKEVILAISPTVEGQTTSLYIKEQISNENIKVSTLAQGIPVGSELDYLDELTLSTALRFRK